MVKKITKSILKISFIMLFQNFKQSKYDKLKSKKIYIILSKLHKKTLQAFSLLEVALSLLLIGIFCSLIFPYMKVVTFAQNQAISKERANYIRKAVEGYVIKYGFLPYASSDNKGLASKRCVSGLVPYRTLGIGKRYIYDGFGKLFSFIVNEQLVDEYWKSQGYKIIPVWMPMSYLQEKNEVRFQRIPFFEVFNYNTKEYVANPGPLKELPKAFDNEQRVRGSTSTFRIRKNDIVGKYSKIMLQGLDNSIDNECETKRYFFIDAFDFKYSLMLVHPCRLGSIEDVLAWALISHGKGELKDNSRQNIIIKCNGSDLVFWQSRFNLVAQLKYPMTTNPVDMTSSFSSYRAGIDETSLYPIGYYS